MKHLSILLVFIFAALIAFSQTTAISIRGGYNTTWLFNKNYNDQMQVSFGHTEGLSFCWYGIPLNFYNDRLYGIAIDVLYATHQQKWKGQMTIPDTSGSHIVDYNREMNFTYVDIPLYFRMAHDQGATYLEVGPQYSILLSATESFSSSQPSVLPGYSDADIKELVPSNAWAIMAGYGFDFPVNLNLFITAGARITYGLTDITKHMQDSTSEYKSTKRATGGLHMSLMYRFNSYHSSKAKVRRR